MKFPESLGRLVHFRNTVSGKTLRREHCVGNTVDTGPKTIGGLASQWRIALDQKNCNFFLRTALPLASEVRGDSHFDEG